MSSRATDRGSERSVCPSSNSPTVTETLPDCSFLPASVQRHGLPDVLEIFTGDWTYGHIDPDASLGRIDTDSDRLDLYYFDRDLWIRVEKDAITQAGPIPADIYSSYRPELAFFSGRSPSP